MAKDKVKKKPSGKKAGKTAPGNEAAAKEVEVLLAKRPLEPRGWYLSALLAEREGKQQQVRNSLTKINELLDPVPIEYMRYRPQVLLLGGQAHYGLGEREKAKPLFEAFQRAQGVGPQRQTGADLAELRSLLEDLDIPPCSSQPQGCGEAADAPTHDDGLALARHRSTLVEPRTAGVPKRQAARPALSAAAVSTARRAWKRAASRAVSSGGPAAEACEVP